MDNNRHRLVTLFLYMVAELSALQQVVNALTGLNGLPAVIVECAVTTIYTSEVLCVFITPFLNLQVSADSASHSLPILFRVRWLWDSSL